MSPPRAKKNSKRILSTATDAGSTPAIEGLGRNPNGQGRHQSNHGSSKTSENKVKEVRSIQPPTSARNFFTRRNLRSNTRITDESFKQALEIESKRGSSPKVQIPEGRNLPSKEKIVGYMKPPTKRPRQGLKQNETNSEDEAFGKKVRRENKTGSKEISGKQQSKGGPLESPLSPSKPSKPASPTFENSKNKSVLQKPSFAGNVFQNKNASHEPLATTKKHAFLQISSENIPKNDKRKETLNKIPRDLSSSSSSFSIGPPRSQSTEIEKISKVFLGKTNEELTDLGPPRSQSTEIGRNSKASLEKSTLRLSQIGPPRSQSTKIQIKPLEETSIKICKNVSTDQKPIEILRPVENDYFSFDSTGRTWTNMTSFESTELDGTQKEEDIVSGNQSTRTISFLSSIVQEPFRIKNKIKMARHQFAAFLENFDKTQDRSTYFETTGEQIESNEETTTFCNQLSQSSPCSISSTPTKIIQKHSEPKRPSKNVLKPKEKRKPKDNSLKKRIESQKNSSQHRNQQQINPRLNNGSEIDKAGFDIVTLEDLPNDPSLSVPQNSPMVPHCCCPQNLVSVGAQTSVREYTKNENCPTSASANTQTHFINKNKPLAVNLVSNQDNPENNEIETPFSHTKTCFNCNAIKPTKPLLSPCRRPPVGAVHPNQNNTLYTLAFHLGNDIAARKPCQESPKLAEQTSRKRKYLHEAYAQTVHCGICFQATLLRGFHQIVSLKCGHLFGRSCITDWFNRDKKRCPKCNILSGIDHIRPLMNNRISVLDNSLEEDLQNELGRKRARLDSLLNQRESLMETCSQRHGQKLLAAKSICCSMCLNIATGLLLWFRR